MSNTYSVVITGELVEGFDVESVQQSFAELFKLSQEKVSSYFSGEPKVLKKAVDHQTAVKYKQRLELAGALVEVRAAEVKKKAAPVNNVKEAVPVEQVEQVEQIETPAKKVPVVSYDDSTMNLIEAGRMKKLQKMEAIELAEEGRNVWFMLVGFICIIFAIADFTLGFFNIIEISDNLLAPASFLLLGLALIKSSNAS